MNKMQFSIIIPVYNQESYIEKCVKSALGQKFDGNYEIIAVNDGSTDKSSKILKSFNDNRLKVFDINNSGVSYARNFALKQALGDFIIFLDGDDYLDCHALENFQSASCLGAADIIFAPYYALRENKKDIKFCFPFEKETYKKLLNSKKEQYRELFFKGNFELCTKAYRRDFLIQNEIFFSDLKIAEDLPFFYKSLIFANNISLCREANYIYRKGHKAAFKAEAVNEVIKAICETDKILKEYKGYKRIEKIYIENTLKTCLYWCKKFRRTKGKEDFYRFCRQYLKEIKSDFRIMFEFYIKLFIGNLVDI